MTAQDRATSELARSIITAADKGFTGALDCSWNDRQVRVFLEHGLVTAVTSPQCPFPGAQLVRTATGQELPTGTSATDFLVTQARFEHARVISLVQDWSYGLAAAALTWPAPKIARRRRAAADGPGITPVAARAFVQALVERLDVSGRAWDTIAERLGGWNPPAGQHPCSVLAVTVEGRDHLCGDAPIDELAFRNGRTRMSVVEHIAGVLEAEDRPDGAQVSFRSVQPAGDVPAVPVPEALEHVELMARPVGVPAEPAAIPNQAAAPAIEQGVFPPVTAAAATAGPAAVPAPPVAEPAPVPMTAPAPVVEAPAPAPVMEAPVEHIAPAPAPVPAPAPAPAYVNPPSTPVAVVASANGSELMDAWVHAASPAEQEARARVLDQMRDAAVELAGQRVEALATVVGELRAASRILSERRAAEQQARSRLQTATEEMVRAEQHVAQIERDGQGLLLAQQRAHDEHEHALSTLENARAQVEDLRSMLARAEAEVTRAHQEAAAAEVNSAVADEQVRQELSGRVEETRRQIDAIRTEMLAPAEHTLGAEARRVADAQDVVRHQREQARHALESAAQQVRVVTDLVPDSSTEALQQRMAELTAAIESATTDQPTSAEYLSAMPGGLSDEHARARRRAIEDEHPSATSLQLPTLRAVPSL